MSIWHIVAIIAGALYVLIGLHYARASVRLFREIVGPDVRLFSELMVIVVAFVAWPFELVRRLWRIRKHLRHWIFGYWPVIAHSANLVSHWGGRREELKGALHPELFHFIDEHMAELAECLQMKYGINVMTQYWRVEPINGEALAELEKLAQGLGKGADDGGPNES